MSNTFEHMVEFLMVYYDMTFDEAKAWYDKNQAEEDLEALIKRLSGLDTYQPSEQMIIEEVAFDENNDINSNDSNDME